MLPPHISSQLALVGLLWLCLMRHYVWPSRGAASPPPLAAPVRPMCQRQRANDPKAVEGLPQQPLCAAWAHMAHHPTPPLPQRPAPLPPTTHRPCAIATARHLCPHVGWA